MVHPIPQMCHVCFYSILSSKFYSISHLYQHSRFLLKDCQRYDLRFVNGLSNIMSHILILKFHPMNCLISIGPSLL